MKKEKGITLIALIITIIVMLILVAVTINIAVNGGLMGKAKSAAKETEKQAIYEQIFTSAVYTDNGKIDVAATVAEIAKTLTVNPSSVAAGTEEVVVTVNGKHGTYKYKISENEVTIEGETENGGGSGTGTVTKEQARLTLQELIDVDPNVSVENSNARIYFNQSTFDFSFNIPNEEIEVKAIDLRNNYSETYLVVKYEGYWYDIAAVSEGTSLTLGTVSPSQYVADANDVFRIQVLSENDKTLKITGLTTNGKELDTIVIPKTITNVNGGQVYTVKEIGDSAFYNAGKNISFASDSEVTSIGFQSFKSAFNRDNMPKNFTLPSKLEYVGGEVMSGYTIGMDGTLYIPKTVTDMGDLAFWETEFSTVIFEEGSQIDHLGRQWFSMMDNLTEIHIPGTINQLDVTAIGRGDGHASEDNSGLTIYFGGTSTKFSGLWYFISNRDVGLTVVCTDGTYTYNSNGEFVAKT